MIKIELTMIDDNNDEVILSQMNLFCNPFEVGDEINVIVKLNEPELINYPPKLQETVLNNYNDLKNKVHFKKVVLTEEKIFLDVEITHEDVLCFSYRCVIVD